MSKNLTSLSKRKGLNDNLFEQIIALDSTDIEQRKQVAKLHLIGEANIVGTASFYDFIQGENADKSAYVCNGSSCLCAGTQDKVKETLEIKYGKDNVGHVTCLGRCHENSAFQIDGVNYSGKDIEQLEQITAKSHADSESYHVVTNLEEPVLTAETGDLTRYYRVLFECLAKHSADDILSEITKSNLRGRGGAGFPTGVKWSSCKAVESDEKYIVCNADEGDPGAYSDRYLLEQRPHSVLFGMLAAGLLVGAQWGVLYIRDEYPASITACEQAINEFKALGLPTNFKFKIIRGAGAYICGEETALIRSIEGQRPMVSTRPPFPTQYGLFGQPTVLNNVETFSAIHFILNKGADSFLALGNGKSTGSKLISLDSAFNRPGIYEVAMGFPLSDLIDLAGGFSTEVKALHIGGPLGGLVPKSHFDTLTLDFESFSQAGFLLGHAGVIGIPENQAMISYIEHLFSFTAAESCGKCYPCRLGATRGEELVADAKEGKPIDRQLLDDLLETMELGSLCALGGGVPLPVKNALTYFQNELSPYFANGQSGGLHHG